MGRGEFKKYDAVPVHKICQSEVVASGLLLNKLVDVTAVFGLTASNNKTVWVLVKVNSLVIFMVIVSVH